MSVRFVDLCLRCDTRPPITACGVCKRFATSNCTDSNDTAGTVLIGMIGHCRHQYV